MSSLMLLTTFKLFGVDGSSFSRKLGIPVSGRRLSDGVNNVRFRSHFKYSSEIQEVQVSASQSSKKTICSSFMSSGLISLLKDPDLTESAERATDDNHARYGIIAAAVAPRLIQSPISQSVTLGFKKSPHLLIKKRHFREIRLGPSVGRSS